MHHILVVVSCGSFIFVSLFFAVITTIKPRNETTKKGMDKTQRKMTFVFCL